ncbi:muts domain V-domain-containing protein [Ganoderma leucocontextum]|nr:muts domain V-domain-containing protein [Ganoderma leucocontextum]
MPRLKHAKRPRIPSTSLIDEELNEEPMLSGQEARQTDDNPRKKVRWDGCDETPEEEDEEESSSSGTTEKVCLAATCQFGRVACAYYDPVKCTIYVFDDTPENQHFDLTKAFLEQAVPDVVLTSSKADDNFIDIFRDYVDGSGGTFQVRPHKEFIPLKGRDRLLSLRLLSQLPVCPNEQDTASEMGSASEPRNAYDFMRRRRETGNDPTMQKWNASVRLANFASIENSPLCLGSIGSLLEYLVRARAVSELEDEGISGLEVRCIEPLLLTHAMQINMDALFSLQIFEDENHASIHSEKTKEGLSLFGILNGTKTTLGRALMREWFLRPSMSLQVINARHDAVACFLRPENASTKNALQGHLNGTKNVPRILGAIRTGKAKVSHWQALVKFAFHALLLRDALSELKCASGIAIVRKLLEALDVSSFCQLGNAVNEIVLKIFIDWEESAIANRVCVRPRVDEELDNLKHVYNGIDSVLSKVAVQMSATIPPDYASSLNVVYFPQLGFLICIPMQNEWRTDAGITVLDGWSFQFSSDSHVYFKSQEMHDMDVHIGDLHPAIVDREIEIVQALQEKILAYDGIIGHACDVCAELDCLVSFAIAACSYDYRRPYMTEGNVIDIKQGRHPLQELVVDTFVPNDAYLVGGAGIGVILDDNASETESEDEQRYVKNSVVVCTGANACGKSVYLKQIALIQYMAQIGCFVPAESAILGIADKIFTRVQTRESVSRVQSAFMIDLNQVSLALRNSTSRSLIILDEFGKGTLPTDGAGLLCGVLKHLLDRGSSCPKVIATTHFHDVFHNDVLSPYRLPISFVHMQVMLSLDKGNGALDSRELKTTGQDDDDDISDARLGSGDKIVYLYKVVNGYSLHSHAITCAELFGVPKRVTSRAQYISQLLAHHAVCQLLDEEMTDGERQELEAAEEVCRKFIAWDPSDRSRSVRDDLAVILGRDI